MIEPTTVDQNEPPARKVGRPRIHPPDAKSDRHEPLARVESMPQRTEQEWVEWFEAARWPEGPYCPKCGGPRTIGRKDAKPQRHRCQECRADFSVKTGTALHSSKMSLSQWARAVWFVAAGEPEVTTIRPIRPGTDKRGAYDPGSRALRRTARVRASDLAKILSTNPVTARKMIDRIRQAWIKEYPAKAERMERESRKWPKRSPLDLDAVPAEPDEVAWALTRGGTSRMRSWFDE